MKFPYQVGDRLRGRIIKRIDQYFLLLDIDGLKVVAETENIPKLYEDEVFEVVSISPTVKLKPLGYGISVTNIDEIYQQIPNIEDLPLEAAKEIIRFLLVTDFPIHPPTIRRLTLFYMKYTNKFLDLLYKISNENMSPDELLDNVENKLKELQKDLLA